MYNNKIQSPGSTRYCKSLAHSEGTVISRNIDFCIFSLTENIAIIIVLQHIPRMLQYRRYFLLLHMNNPAKLAGSYRQYSREAFWINRRMQKLHRGRSVVKWLPEKSFWLRKFKNLLQAPAVHCQWFRWAFPSLWPSARLIACIYVHELVTQFLRYRYEFLHTYFSTIQTDRLKYRDSM